MENIIVKIKRRENTEQPPYWEEFLVAVDPNSTVADLLQAITRNPVNVRRETVSPVVWGPDGNRTALLVNGQAKLAGVTLVRPLRKPIVLEPLSKFPVIRDLKVDLSSLEAGYAAVQAWAPVETVSFLPPLATLSESQSHFARDLGRCIDCGICLEVCPQVNDRSSFLGPAALGKARYYDLLPQDEGARAARVDVLLGRGGIEDCGHAQNCQAACPVDVPLLDVIGEWERRGTKRLFRWFFG